MLHHIRHGAALLFSQLEFKGAARLNGWVDLKPQWQVRKKVYRIKELMQCVCLLLMQLGPKGAARLNSWVDLKPQWQVCYQFICRRKLFIRALSPCKKCMATTNTPIACCTSVPL